MPQRRSDLHLSCRTTASRTKRFMQVHRRFAFSGWYLCNDVKLLPCAIRTTLSHSCNIIFTTNPSFFLPDMTLYRSSAHLFTNHTQAFHMSQPVCTASPVRSRELVNVGADENLHLLLYSFVQLPPITCDLHLQRTLSEKTVHNATHYCRV